MARPEFSCLFGDSAQRDSDLQRGGSDLQRAEYGEQTPMLSIESFWLGTSPRQARPGSHCAAFATTNLDECEAPLDIELTADGILALGMIAVRAR